MWWLVELYYRIDPAQLRRAALELGVALLYFGSLAVAVTWPAAVASDEVLLGGGELGGWLWRQWWHFQEVAAIDADELGLIGSVEALLGLGRYPETGNILDLLLISYPLDLLVGFPAHHNHKVLLILLGNGLCGYALARSFTSSRVAAAAAASVAIVNPLIFQDVDKTGLRQVLLWWVLLYPALLARAQRSRDAIDAVLAGLCLAMAAAFYWFYGLFLGMFTFIHMAAWWWTERPRLGALLRQALPGALAAGLVALLFLSPYLQSGEEEAGRGGLARLPEVSFFVPFPAYDTIAEAPLRPSSYRDNVLSSLHRTIESGWPVDYVWNPAHGVKALPTAVFFCGVIPAFFLRGARLWLFIWLFFWAGTLGPYLKIGAQKDTSEVLLFFGDHVLRLPYALLFQWVPGMSRMFAPYRLAAVMVAASVALLALVLDRLSPTRRTAAGLLIGAAVVLQPFYRFDLGPVEEGSGGPAMWRVPTQVSAMRLPEWYQRLDPAGWEGLIELPLDQQQDLLCAYQVFHRRKVYRSWASAPAIPPSLRSQGGGEAGRRLRWLAQAEPRRDPALELFRALSEDPLAADASQLRDQDLDKLMAAGDYRYLIVHERGYLLTRTEEGTARYRHTVRLLSERLGLTPEELVEQQAFDWPGKGRHFPQGPAWIPWASQEVSLPAESMPDRYFMAVFDLKQWQAQRADLGTGGTPP